MTEGRCPGRLLRRILGFALVAGLAACSTPSPIGEAPRPESAPAQPPSQPPQAATTPEPLPPGPVIAPPTPSTPGPARIGEASGIPRPVIRTMDGYKREVAMSIYRASAEHLYEGVPPPVLKSIVILDISIDRDGRIRRLNVMRSNGYKALEQLAMQSVRRAAPLPPPDDAVVTRAGHADFVETWLFRDDGRFQIRSLAEKQASIDAKPG